ncbi:MAG: hypothetical protein ACRCV0_07240 [Brevinema sp.]
MTFFRTFFLFLFPFFLLSYTFTQEYDETYTYDDADTYEESVIEDVALEDELVEDLGEDVALEDELVEELEEDVALEDELVDELEENTIEQTLPIEVPSTETTNTENTTVLPIPNPTNTNTTVETIVTKKKLILPVLQDYKPILTVDPINPELPANHQLKKIRNSIWRGTKRILSTNKYGVVQARRVYLFFSEDRDAIAYRYMPYDSRHLPSEPSQGEYIPLIPLLQTNTVPNLESVTLKKFKDIPLNTNAQDYQIQFDIGTQITNIPSFNISQTNTNITILNTPTNKAAIAPIVPQSETNEPSVEIVQDQPNDNVLVEEEAVDLENELETEILDEEVLSDDQGYEDDPVENEYARLTYREPHFVAQLMSTPEQNQYVINIGGQNAGIFVHKTRNPEKPYKVIFLSMESGIVLYELSIENSFNVRVSDSQAVIEARELYIKLLNDRINFQKYDQITMGYLE